MPCIHSFVRSFVVAMARSRVACSLPAAKHCTVPYRTRCQTQTQRPTHQRNATQGPPSTACDAKKTSVQSTVIHFFIPALLAPTPWYPMAWHGIYYESSHLGGLPPQSHPPCRRSHSFWPFFPLCVHYEQRRRALASDIKLPG
mmetsp:Transcript_20998/g.45766  ORF Transcript_20998/g.45766 Transcript_20998/m.45766 type:complete len:143 (-) Transcript_20998:300-728(-)